VPSIALVAMIRPDPRDIAANLAAYYPGLEVAPPTRPATSARIGLLSILWRYPGRVGFVASFAVQGNMSMNMALTSLALAEHGHELAEISVAMSIHAIGMFGLSLPLGRLTDRVGRRNVMLVGVVIALLGSCLVSVASAYAVITAGTFLVGLGWSCVSVAVVALLADTTGPLERGRVVGANDTCGGIASIALALLAGPVVALAGLPAVAVVSAILMAPPLVMLLQLREPTPGIYTAAAL